MENFRTVILNVFQCKVNNIINPVSQLLQKDDQDISCSSAMLQRDINPMKSLRCLFQEVHDEAVKLAGVWCVNSALCEKRIPRVPRQFDENAVDQRLQDPVKSFEINVFIASIDIMVTQLESRFAGAKKVAATFQCLSPQFLSSNSCTDEVVSQSAASLSATYSCDISDEFTTQILSFRALFQNDIKKIATVAELADFLIVRNYSLVPMFPDLYAAFLLFLTLPVTVATAERSFLKLKLIKTYLRNSMLQDRLSGLAVLPLTTWKRENLTSTKLLTIVHVERRVSRRYDNLLMPVH
jgi:hypothetical protein